ncbi:kinesin-domain-containing protein [Panus rudis PR-1116 ss-1]|nr:kinesin-domain-containing protein [Panus rudis PR-1116 ss-1]
MVAAGSITVAVRVRPPTPWEAARLPEQVYDNFIRGDAALSTPSRPLTSQSCIRDIVQIVDDRVLTFDPAEKDPSKAFMERGFLPPGTKRYKDRRFIFDRVFNHDAQQREVYENTAKPLLKNLLDGFNATIFAYGATGCGKTHTISGTETDPGIIYLTMADLFSEIEDRREEYNVDVSVTFLEIYNEEIRDLLSEPGSPTPRGGLQIREDKTVKVVGLVELRPSTADEVKQIVLQGNMRRTQSPTHANETSSRSHAVLQIHVTQSPRTASLTEERTMATLSIIDLAGSERAAATTNMGQRMVEGANINKSLLALGNCINALCESGGATRHIPYRNSKLTRLLKFSLGGNCKTVMIVCVAPTSIHFDDTHNTLLYAERATKIKTKVVTRNVVNVDRHVGQYVEAIKRLNDEVAELKAKLAGKRDAEMEKENRRKKEASAEVERAKKDMQLKTEQTQASIVDGANCAGKLSVAEAKLKVIRARLAELDAQASSSSSGPSADIEAERGLLQALARPEEEVLKAQSALNARLQKSNNSGAMFEATLRAMSERRSDKLDETTVDNIKLDARWRKAEMERIKAEAKREALQEAVQGQAETVVGLIGMVGRCTVMLSQASRMLQETSERSGSDMPSAVQAIASSLRNVAEGNDEAFKALLGHSTAQYALGPMPQGTSAFEAFKYPTNLGKGRISSGPVITQQPKTKVSRRTSSYGSSVSSPLRKSHHRSPRKSLRSSLAPPYRKVSDKEKGKKKGVQWKDEAGQGDIDDGGLGNTPIIAVMSPGNSVVPSADDSPFVESASGIRLGRSTPLGSESEWEDEKTDDSVSFSLSSAPSLNSSFTGNGDLRVGGKRPRASRLDPNFLKNRSRGSVLSSLAEADESQGSPKRAPPLSDRNMNRVPSPTAESSSSSGSTNDTLTVPKNRDKVSPSKRMPTALRATAISASKSGRRKSNIGPVRPERGRRRSSMIPQLSPAERRDSGELRKSVSSGPRRVPMSPAKRAKRPSLLMLQQSKLATTSKLRDANTSGELSFRGIPRPTWR